MEKGNLAFSVVFFTVVMLGTMAMIAGLIINHSAFAVLYMFPLPMIVIVDIITGLMVLTDVGVIPPEGGYQRSKAIKPKKPAKLVPLPLHARIEALESEIRDLDDQLIRESKL